MYATVGIFIQFSWSKNGMLIGFSLINAWKEFLVYTWNTMEMNDFRG